MGVVPLWFGSWRWSQDDLDMVLGSAGEGPRMTPFPSEPLTTCLHPPWRRMNALRCGTVQLMPLHNPTALPAQAGGGT